MIFRYLIASAIALALISTSAEARHATFKTGGRVSCDNRFLWTCDTRGWHPAPGRRASDARPSAWCGWWMRQQVGRDPGPAFNLARNWARWGSPARPEPGAIVVWPHHVGMITGRTADGQWIVKSGNDGHAVRERPRSLAGAIAFREG